MICVEGLTFRYPGSATDAIRELAVDIKAGSLFGLLGPNGSGKTTLMSLVFGLLIAHSGRIHVDGKAMPAERRAIQAGMALVPQEYAFYPRLTVIENLCFFAGAHGLEPVERAPRIRDAVITAGLAAFEKTRAQRLSGGLKRRLNLAIGLLNAPRILFLDEPTAGIDPQSRHFILEAIKRINANGATVVYTSHYMEEVEALCDDVAIMDQGRVIARGDLQSLLRRGEGGQLTVGLSEPPPPDFQARLVGFPDLQMDGSVLRLPNCCNEQLRSLLGLLAEYGAQVGRVRYGYADLEDLFLQLTGRQLRD